MSGPVKVAVAAVRLLAGPGAPGPGLRALTVITLISWLLTASIGAYMLGTWIGSGGVRKQRANTEGLSPAVVLGHASLATTGLVLWTAYTLTRWAPLAWSGVLVLMPAIGLGLSTVTLLTPFPAPDRARRGRARQQAHRQHAHARAHRCRARRQAGRRGAGRRRRPGPAAAGQGACGGPHPGEPRRPRPDHLPARRPRRGGDRLSRPRR